MDIFYVDESYDQSVFVLSCLRVPAADWKAVLDRIKGLRGTLRTEFGIKLKSELHAQTFVRHCSDGVSFRKLSLRERREIFEAVIRFIAGLPVEVINICLPLTEYSGRSHETHFQALNRLFNRIQTNVRKRDSHAIVIFDSGKEQQVTKLSRRLSAFNYIPSQYGSWPSGSRSKHIPTERILEDPVFRDSKTSYFLQLVDFIAYALLKREVQPTPFVSNWGYNTLFDILRPVLCLAACGKDKDGIVRG